MPLFRNDRHTSDSGCCSPRNAGSGGRKEQRKRWACGTLTKGTGDQRRRTSNSICCNVSTTVPTTNMPVSSDVITKFTNCRLIRDHRLFEDHLWVRSGVIIDPEPCFFDEKRKADVTIDCGGLILAPGFIDLQINGTRGKHGSGTPDPVFVFVLLPFHHISPFPVRQVGSDMTFRIRCKLPTSKKRWMPLPEEFWLTVSPHSVRL